MIDVKSLLNLFKKNKINFFSGVPDSILKELSSYLENKNKKDHVIAANEGAAVSIGVGNYLSTKKIPCIYMQNSGLSNALNPLISIADKKVYSIPLILIIGWRGSPKFDDEPQHLAKGKITKNLLKLLKIKHTVLRKEKDLLKLNRLIREAKNHNKIVACLIEKGTLQKIKKEKKKSLYKLDKIFFLTNLLEILQNKDKIISSTGFNSRQLLYVRKKFNFSKGKDFYMVGGMGHTSSVALGYSLASKKRVICLDGDGSFLMHLGSIKTIGSFAKNNLKYILLNNNSHDSVGGQSTYADKINFKNLSKSLGFKNFFSIDNRTGLKKKLKNFLNKKGPNFLEVKVSNNTLSNLPRPKDLKLVKNEFMK